MKAGEIVTAFAELGRALGAVGRLDDLGMMWGAMMRGIRAYRPVLLPAEKAEAYAAAWRDAGFDVTVGDTYPDDGDGVALLTEVVVTW